MAGFVLATINCRTQHDQLAVKAVGGDNEVPRSMCGAVQQAFGGAGVGAAANKPMEPVGASHAISTVLIAVLGATTRDT